MIKVKRSVATPNPFARQTLIPGWNQDVLGAARVLIAGVGALGNACAADLALTGIGNFILIDFDSIDTSNLSRTILFRRGDEGQPKVERAAERLRDLALTDRPSVVTMATDVVWDVGLGVYRRVDAVFGCVDSAEARAAVGSAAWSFGLPAIFGGIYGYHGSVMMQGGLDGPCVACSFSKQEWRDMGRRYSCDQVRRTLAEDSKIPTTQVSSAFTSAFMVQEFLKTVHGQPNNAGGRIFIAGQWPTIDRFSILRSARCPFHRTIDSVREAPELSSKTMTGDLIEYAAKMAGGPVSIELGRDFVLTSNCKACGSGLRHMRPRHRMFERDLICERCRVEARQVKSEAAVAVLSAMDAGADRSLLDLTLEDLGIPPLHVLEVRSARGSSWIELTGDAGLLGSWPHKGCYPRQVEIES